jgi:signal transduction histidine kinase
VPPGLDPLSLAAGAALAGGLAALAAAMRAAARRRRGVGPERLARAVLEPLGDALLALDADGRVVQANPAAEALLGASGAALAGRPVASLGTDLAVLRHGAPRGPSAGLATILTARGPVLAHAAVVRVAAQPARDLALLRPVAAVPPALPPPPEPPLEVEPMEDGAATPALAAVAAALREPFGRASASASYVRLLAPPLPPHAAEALDRLEEALEDLARRLAALGASDARGADGSDVALAPLVRDLLAAWAPPAGVRVRVALADATARADERALRAALRELLRAAGVGAARGREVLVSVSVRGGAALVEIAGAAPGCEGAVALARALVHAQGGRVEEEGHGGDRLLRLVLPLAAAPTAAPVAPPCAAPAAAPAR